MQPEKLNAPVHLRSLNATTSATTMSWHTCLDIRGFLKNAKKRQYKIFRHDDGRCMTFEEARDALCDELSKGHEVLPMGQCDNFDFKTGCKGHPIESDFLSR